MFSVTVIIAVCPSVASALAITAYMYEGISSMYLPVVNGTCAVPAPKANTAKKEPSRLVREGFPYIVTVQLIDVPAFATKMLSLDSCLTGVIALMSVGVSPPDTVKV